LLGVKSGLGHDLLGFNKVRVIRVPPVNIRISQIKFRFLNFLSKIVIEYTRFE